MRRLKTTFILAIAVAGLFGLNQKAQAHADVCAVLYEDSNYGGHNYIAWGLSNSEAHVGNFNDKTSSVYVAPNCQIVLYEDSNFNGLSQTYTHSESYTGNIFNDQVSSFKCSCTK